MLSWTWSLLQTASAPLKPLRPLCHWHHFRGHMWGDEMAWPHLSPLSRRSRRDVRFVFILQEPEGPTFLVPAGGTLLLKGGDWPKGTLLHPQEGNPEGRGRGAALWKQEAGATGDLCPRAQSSGRRGQGPASSSHLVMSHCCHLQTAPSGSPVDQPSPASSSPSNNPQH